MTRAQREKQKKLRQLPSLIMNDEQQKLYEYCLRNNIIIGPVACLDNRDGFWQIGISTPDDHRKIYRSPEICDKHSLWEVMFKYMTYYYDKSKENVR